MTRDLRVIELACGTGTMTQWLAEQIGPEGRVVGVDSSEPQLATARVRVGGAPSVELLCADAAETGLPREGFDLVYLRLLLMHVKDPMRVLTHARELLHPGGVLVCEEAAVDSTFTDPPRPEQAELHALANQMARERGCDYNVARRLSSLVRAAGFDQLAVSAHQPVYVSGSAKQLEVASFEEALAHWRGAAQSALEAGHRICKALREAAYDNECTYGLSMMVQVCAKRPARSA
jgi:ubiquinone/menaquinone biosynthesis C-methylase UbiE